MADMQSLIVCWEREHTRWFTRLWIEMRVLKLRGIAFRYGGRLIKTTKAEFLNLSEEIEILKKVRHPNIINFHDCWFGENEFVFITELMTSGTLRE